MSASQPPAHEETEGQPHTEPHQCSSTQCTVPPLLADALQQSAARFRTMCAQLDRINAAQLQQHMEVISSLPPAAVTDKVDSLQRWIIDLGFKEGSFCFSRISFCSRSPRYRSLRSLLCSHSCSRRDAVGLAAGRALRDSTQCVESGGACAGGSGNTPTLTATNALQSKQLPRIRSTAEQQFGTSPLVRAEPVLRLLRLRSLSILPSHLAGCFASLSTHGLAAPAA